MATTETTPQTDTAVVRGFLEAFARRDMDTARRLMSAETTWNHHNNDSLGGVHRGVDAILAYLGETRQLTDGDIHPMPKAFMADGQGRVTVLVEVTGSRPDGRTLCDLQLALFVVDGEQIRSVDQYIADHAAVTAFWA